MRGLLIHAQYHWRGTPVNRSKEAGKQKEDVPYQYLYEEGEDPLLALESHSKVPRLHLGLGPPCEVPLDILQSELGSEVGIYDPSECEDHR